MYWYFVLNLLLKLRICRYLFIKFKMTEVNPCEFAVARQTFFERRAIITIGSNYQKRWKHRESGRIWIHISPSCISNVNIVTLY